MADADVQKIADPGLRDLLAAGQAALPRVPERTPEVDRHRREQTSSPEAERRAYDEKREQSRREFELDLEEKRAARERARQEYDSILAAEGREAERRNIQMQWDATLAHTKAADAIVRRQMRVTRACAFAAMAAAIAALCSTGVTAYPILADWYVAHYAQAHGAGPAKVP